MPRTHFILAVLHAMFDGRATNANRIIMPVRDRTAILLMAIALSATLLWFLLR